MDPSDWLQGTMHEEARMDTSSLSGDIITCSRPLVERRVRPPHDQALKCPRCDSTHTKFCYYNNYSLSQPRYFCKACRRYWTKGGTLRNIPVGGGCRKNKKVSTKKSNDHQQVPNQNPSGSSSSSSRKPTDLQLSYPLHEAQFSHLCNFLENNGGLGNTNFPDTKYNLMVENHGPIEFMDPKYQALVGQHGEFGIIGGVNDVNYQGLGTSFASLCSPFGMSTDVNNGTIMMDTCERLMMPYENPVDQSAQEVKPNIPKLLSLDWHNDDEGGSDVSNQNFGYVGGLGSWTGFMNGYGSSATNPLV